MKYTIWRDGEFFIGFWNEYPNYQTQGFSKEELLGNLNSLLEDIKSGEIPHIQKLENKKLARLV